MNTCGNCVWGLLSKGQIYCNCHPPTVLAMPQKNPLTQEVSFGIVGTLPPVREDRLACSLWKQGLRLRAEGPTLG